jgi:hypothetical protein
LVARLRKEGRKWNCTGPWLTAVPRKEVTVR